MTILYNSEDHLSLIFSFKGTVWIAVLPFCLLTVAISVGIYILGEDFYDVIELTFPKESGFETLTTLLSFLVVSRVTRSYQRMWQARSMMSGCLQNGRDLAVLVATLSACFPNEMDHQSNSNSGAKRWHEDLSNALCAMIDGLTDVMSKEDLTVACVLGDPTITSTTETQRQQKSNIAPPEQKTDPFFLANQVHLLINNHSQYLGRTMEVQREVELHRQISDFSKNYYDLLKYASTPVPFPTTQMAQTILLLWVCLLPAILLYRSDDDPELQPSTVAILSVVAFLGTYGFWGLERVAEELDLPFGDDENDIEIDELAKVCNSFLCIYIYIYVYIY